MNEASPVKTGARGIAAMSSEELTRRMRDRYRAEKRFRAYGIVAIVIGITFLVILFGTIIGSALSAFRTNVLELTVPIAQNAVDPSGERDPTTLQMANWNGVLNEALFATLDLPNRPIRLIDLLRLRRGVNEADIARELSSLVDRGLVTLPGATALAQGVELSRLMDTEAYFRGGMLPLPEIPAAVRTAINGNVAGLLRPTLGQRTVSLRQLGEGVIFNQEEANQLAARIQAGVSNPNLLPPRFDQYLFRDLNASLLAAMSERLAQSRFTLSDIQDSRVQRAMRSHLQSLASQLLSTSAQFMLRDKVLEDLGQIGRSVTIEVPLHSNVDMLLKGQGGRELGEERRLLNNLQLQWIDILEQKGALQTPFNWGLFFDGDSRAPETAGLGVAIIGSAYMMLIVLVLALPLGVATAVYLEEFAPKNRWTDLIEVNINNLAAVPSIVFGLLGLAVFINFMELPRSAPIVGGLVLTLMTLPTVIIATRAALKAVPPSIREAALGVGASKVQSIWHHVLPLAMPGILTGTIIGLAQALGETAPLIMIGMVAFVADFPGSPLEPASALPVQVYNFSRQQERGFVELTSASILVLLGFLIIMNAAAIWLRRRFERRW